MAVYVHLYVGNDPVGRMKILRTDGHIGGRDNEYTVDVVTAPHPMTGFRDDIEGLKVKHNYNDSVWELVRKACEAVLNP